MNSYSHKDLLTSENTTTATYFSLQFPVFLLIKLCCRATREKRRSWLNLDHLLFFRWKKKKKKNVLPNYCFFFHVLVKCKQLHAESHNIIVHYYRVTRDAEISSGTAPRRLTRQHTGCDCTKHSSTPAPLLVAFGQ